jgi:hypothetical protein
MLNPFDIFPKHIDSNLRIFIIVLVVIQFLAFLIWMGYLISQYLEIRKKNREGNSQENLGTEKSSSLKQD